MTETGKVNFKSIAIAIITAGAFVFAFGVVGWLFNIFTDYSFVLPSSKIIGGLVIMPLGYIILQLELIRNK
ncbi:MAG: hypothetical protein WCG48_01190 [Candidatus Berkelbacteria bacterium]